MSPRGDPTGNPFRVALERLRAAVREADCVLTGAAFAQVRALHQLVLDAPENRAHLARLAPEYGRPEFLACVDAVGAIVPAALDSVREFEVVARRYPELQKWHALEGDPQAANSILLCSAGSVIWSACGTAPFRSSLITRLSPATP